MELPIGRASVWSACLTRPRPSSPWPPDAAPGWRVGYAPSEDILPECFEQEGTVGVLARQPARSVLAHESRQFIRVTGGMTPLQRTLQKAHGGDQDDQRGTTN